MNHRLLVAALLSFVGADPATAHLAIQPGTISPIAPLETKARLNPERMEELVAGPIATVRRGDLAGGERAFETLLAAAERRGTAGRVMAADLLESFGVLVYTEGLLSSDTFEPDDELRTRSLLYLRRAIDAYRSAFGPNHPEVAVALHSYADVIIALQPDDPPAGADTALEEAYRIRRAALGPANPETLAALGRLAEIRSLPSRTRRDPGQVAAAAAMYREVLGHARHASGQSPEEQPMRWYSRLAQLYARNGQASAAVAVVGEAEAEREADGRYCFDLILMAAEVADLLDERGFETETQALRKRFPETRLAACPDQENEELPLDRRISPFPVT